MPNLNTQNPLGLIRKISLTLILWFTTGLLSLSQAATITYHHFDALGSPVASTDEAGQVVWREAYQPFGTRLRKETQDNTLWYTGKPTEEFYRVSYFGARWYNPEMGRFMAMDPVGVQEGNIHSFNRYTYGNNNPYRFIDPDGRAADPNNPIPSSVKEYKKSRSSKKNKLMQRALQEFNKRKNIKPNSPAPKHNVVNALKNFQSRNYKFGNQTFKLDKSGMKHILERHHPNYWNGSTKAKQSFFSSKMDIKNVESAISNVLKQNRAILSKKGTNGMFQISGQHNGVKYYLGINKGRVGQFFPKQ